MFLYQPDHNSKPQRACTSEDHAAIKASAALFATLTTPCGYQADGAGGLLKLGSCRNCGSTIARDLDATQRAMIDLAIGGAP
jgi:hypothetical protein